MLQLCIVIRNSQSYKCKIMNQVQKDQLVNNAIPANESKVETLELGSSAFSVKHAMPLGIWVLLIAIWYTIALNSNSSLIEETLPSIIIITICLIIRFLSQPRR
ncbi:MAG: hypothetical protein ACI9FN_002971 [Saprospiraceae bacterium]|jgi:hypothetical protein